MAVWRQTSYTIRTERLGDGPRVEAAPNVARVALPIQVTNAGSSGGGGAPLGCFAVTRATAQEDFLGWNLCAQIPGNPPFPSPVRYVSRVVPMQYFPGTASPANPGGSSGLYASSLVNGQGSGYGSPAPDGDVDYSGPYLWTLTFEPRDYLIDEDDAVRNPNAPDATHAFGGLPDEGYFLAYNGWLESRYVSKRVRPGSRLTTFPPSLLRWASDKTNIALSFPVKEAFQEINYIWQCVPYAAVPQQGVQAMLATVNGISFDGYPPGTLLFDSAGVDVYPGPLGDLLATVTYRVYYMAHRNNAGSYLGHNSALRFKPASGGTFSLDYEKVIGGDDTTARPIFPSTCFHWLFRPDQTWTVDYTSPL
jgi:hypothetical protein